MSVPRNLVRGDRYRVVHQIPGVQRYARVSVLTFLGYDGDELAFSARPEAGTVNFPESHISEVTRVDRATPIFVNRRA